jgi:hypothetical protein
MRYMPGLDGICVLRATTFEFVVANNERLYSRHRRAHVLLGGIAAIPSISLSLSPPLNFLVLADAP